jgi:hypothetical protein
MSAPIPILYKGENRLITLPLLLENGITPLLVSTLTHASVQLYQGATLVGTYTMGTDTELRAGEETDELILELTSELTAALTARQPLEALFTLKVADNDFEAEPGAFIDKQKATLVTQIL